MGQRSTIGSTKRRSNGWKGTSASANVRFLVVPNSLLGSCLLFKRAHRVTDSSLWQQIAMDRAQILLVGLPLFLLCTDLIHLFTPPPPKPPPHHHHHHPHPHHHHKQPPVGAHETLGSPTQVKYHVNVFILS